MTIKLAKVKDPYLEPSQTSMSSFEKIVNGLEKNSWKKLYHRYMIPNTLLTILRWQESQSFLPSLVYKVMQFCYQMFTIL